MLHAHQDPPLHLSKGARSRDGALECALVLWVHKLDGSVDLGYARIGAAAKRRQVAGDTSEGIVLRLKRALLQRGRNAPPPLRRDGHPGATGVEATLIKQRVEGR
jgi:hypothetical protein